MIRSVEIGDFLSHTSTKLDFDTGVTVFVGANGSGKSSIIDAITFALFGQHVRKSNKGLIRRGSLQCFTKVDMTIHGKQYRAERKINTKGVLAAHLSENRSGQWTQIAAGERKQFGESMTEHIEKIIGLTFDKLKIASIVQQGQLNSIITAKPKEFKELLNAIIGIDKLDVSSETMKVAIKEFRASINQKLGYDDTHIDILQRDQEKSESELTNSEPLRDTLDSKRKQIVQKLKELEARIAIESPKLAKIGLLNERTSELRNYGRNVVGKIEADLVQKQRKITDCKGCFVHVKQKVDLESKIKTLNDIIDGAQKNIQELTNQKASLSEKLKLAAKLHLKDNRCPVCDSTVEKLNPLFDEDHLRQEIKKIDEDVLTSQQRRQTSVSQSREFVAQLQKSRDAEATLRAHSINTLGDLEQLEYDVQTTNDALTQLRSDDLKDISKIDSNAKMLFDTITDLQNETRGFNQAEFDQLKKSQTDTQHSLSEAERRYGAVTETIKQANIRITNTKKIIVALELVREYIGELDVIQSNIFNRDGVVATSLRSWALETISLKTSEYLAKLNTKIQRIHLAEKSRDISIICNSNTEELDIESLSGGEKVSVALALRLGMASLLGASNLNFMILDEPTTHLDSEGRKSLVDVLSQLADTKSADAMQFIIISHDSEIFEGSNVDMLYKFESSNNGTIVTAF